LQDVSVELRAGEIHALMGENGSGKSTLLSILAGALPADAGLVTIDGVGYPGFFSPKQARALGVSLVQQEPQLAPALTVGENIMMGRLNNRRGFVAWRDVHREAERVLDILKVDIPSRAVVSSLSAGRRQLIEVAKGLVDSPRILLLDEATSSLDDTEAGALFDVLRRLCAQGVAIAFVSHRLKEVMNLADRATVLRDGCFVGSVMMDDIDERKLVSMMVGRNLETYWHKAKVAVGEPILEVSGLHRGPLKDISISVRQGEIVGLAGLVGSGRSALMRTLMGVKAAQGGTIRVAGKPVTITNPRAAHRLGMAYVPEDRKAEGLVMGWSVLRNAAMTTMNNFGPLTFLSNRFDQDALARGSRGLKIKSRSGSQAVRELSGGNQQKVVLAREIVTNPLVLLLDEPTRGIDVGAKEDIYAQLAELARRGVGMLVASSELTELLGICDRIYVMFKCRVVAEIPVAEASEETITSWTSGAHELALEGAAA
jgi:ABC-type sugar transport system ATPase subunit